FKAVSRRLPALLSARLRADGYRVKGWDSSTSRIPFLGSVLGSDHELLCDRGLTPFYRLTPIYLRAFQTEGRPVLELHAKSEASCSEHFLDLVERLATQVGSLEQFVLGTLNEIADVVDVFRFEAVGGTHRELEIVDRAQKHRIDLRLGTAGSLVAFVGAFQRGEHGQLIHEDTCGLAHGFFRGDHAVGLDVENELVQVGTLFHTRAFHGIANATHRAVRGVQNDAADGVGAVVCQGANVARHIAAALLDLELHFQLAGFSQRGDHVIRIDDFDVVRQIDVRCGDHTGALTTQGQGDFLAVMELEHHALEVQQDVDHVLAHARQRGVFV